MNKVNDFTYDKCYEVAKKGLSKAERAEAFGAVKEIKVGGLERIYINRFSIPAKKLANVNILFGFIKEFSSK